MADSVNTPDLSPARVGAPTLRDVAADAQVDASTVSKVLKGHGISVRPETRDRIMRSVERMGYRPNSVASGLRLRRTGALGLLLPDITNPVYAAIVHGAVGRAEELGYSLLIADTSATGGESSYRRMVDEKRIDGFLIATARKSGALVESAERDLVPHVFVNRRVAGSIPSVTVDDEQGAALAAHAMHAHGHSRLGVVAGPADIDTAERRLKGFLDSAAELELPRPSVKTGEFTAAGGFQAMSALLELPRRPTAVFVSSFVAAVGALRAAHDAGVRVPEDVSLVSFDDAEVAQYLIPSLTTIRMPFAEMGALAIDTLVELLGGQHPSSAVVSTAPVLEKRDSLAFFTPSQQAPASAGS